MLNFYLKDNIAKYKNMQATRTFYVLVALFNLNKVAEK